mmetsp:Transcript_4871/g.14294  ORF Transcript_4871/g.14294 Transcript_4871/m.14294 type:complete len:213 (+) Transcript_4871:138-776(+)
MSQPAWSQATRRCGHSGMCSLRTRPQTPLGHSTTLWTHASSCAGRSLAFSLSPHPRWRHSVGRWSQESMCSCRAVSALAFRCSPQPAWRHMTTRLPQLIMCAGRSIAFTTAWQPTCGQLTSRCLHASACLFMSLAMTTQSLLFGHATRRHGHLASCAFSSKACISEPQPSMPHTTDRCGQSSPTWRPSSSAFISRPQPSWGHCTIRCGHSGM